VSLALTFSAWIAASWETTGILQRRLQLSDLAGSVEQLTFILIIQALIYGNFVYQFTRLGYLRRRLAHQPLSPIELEALYDGTAPKLAILVPSYKEEPAVVRRTLLSAALQDYPDRRVVLLLDDPPETTDPADCAALAAMRQLPRELNGVLHAAARPFHAEYKAYLSRRATDRVDASEEAARLAALYEQAALWFETTAAQQPMVDHADQLFVDEVLGRAARAHRNRARELRSSAGGGISRSRIEREYARLAAVFRVEVGSFERKRYVNLSRERNKAMNLNSYIALIGGYWNQVVRADGLHLIPSKAYGASLYVPPAEFIVTLDADSLLVPEYALVLVNEMQRPGNERLAVAQTPYNTIPNPPGALERVAGATTDIQYLIHQGFTSYGATYWVGANALLRLRALREIKQEVVERDFTVPVFIQDRTVIEDTESSVDLVARGWKLYNYPERLAFSATPPDFGSLLIQRRRWANGGLIILPKLLRYLASGLRRPAVAAEGFFRVHYLGSIAAVNIGLLVLLGHSFERSVNSLFLPLTALPYFLLYIRDLRYSGYSAGDMPRIYALNLLLIPVNLGGVLMSIRQALTGRRIPFGRTPKVVGRTAAPARYVVAEYALLIALLIGSCIDVASGHWMSAAFCLANMLMLAYAIHVFVGVRESWRDIALAVPKRWRKRSLASASATSKAAAHAMPQALVRARVAPPANRSRRDEAGDVDGHPAAAQIAAANRRG
jgi:cellulose synthase (UDP-forming)